MDYALSNAVQYRTEGITSTLVLYDVMCQYGVHLAERFDRNPYLEWPRDMKMAKGIGLFHVHGHQRLCELRYSPSFIAGAGEVDGEILETMWASLNRVSGSTRTMSTSHRQEMLDWHMNDWNWKKLITIGAF